jgi:hypothetical protein
VIQCHEPDHLLHVFGRCITSPQELRELLACANSTRSVATIPAVVQLGSEPALAMVQASTGLLSTNEPHSLLVDASVDLLVRVSACAHFEYLPTLYWSLVPVWTCSAVVWIALSCQVHASFATTIHSVMTVVPVIKLLECVICGWLWTDCVASGTFSVATVLAWVAVRSLYEPFLLLVLLLIAHGWCTLRRDMPRATALAILAAITVLYIVLAFNFLHGVDPSAVHNVLRHV